MTASNKPNEIQLTRLYNAPVERVWQAWTDPEQAAKWWGPRGFTLTTHSKDLRPGGIWNYTMHGPDGVDYPNNTVYLQVERHKLLVYDHGASEDRPPLFRVTVVFSSCDDKTKMEMTLSLPTAEEAEKTRQFIKQAGGNATWDRLAEFLEKETTGRESFVINRSFRAPLELIYEMWTNPDCFAKWLPPTGFEMNFLRCDMRPGGSAFYLMTNNAGLAMHCRCEYQAIDPPHRLEYTHQFCDENENVGRHPLSPNWPATMLTTVELTAEGPDGTRITSTSQPTAAATPEELKTFVDARAEMTQGWTNSFDQLEAMLPAIVGQ